MLTITIQRIWIILLLAIFFRPAASVTDFVGEDELIAAQSVKPCHLYGNPDVYGPGVRSGFYLQYFAAILAILMGLRNELIVLRQGLIVLAFAVLISLYVNSLGNGVYVLDWIIVVPLVVLPPFFTIALPHPVGFQYQSYSAAVQFLDAFIQDQGDSPTGAPLKGGDIEHQQKQGSPSWAKKQKEKLQRRMKVYEKNVSNTELVFGFDRTSTGVALLVYSMYLFTQVKLYWFSIFEGRKPGCDIRIFPFYFPVSLYNETLVRFLKTMAIIGAIFAGYTVVLGLILVPYGISKSWTNQMALAKKEAQEKGAEKGKLSKVTKLEKEEIKQEIEELKFRGYAIRFILILFGSLPAFVTTVVITELMVRINHIDMGQHPFSSTSQLLALLVGLGTSIPVFWHALVKLVRKLEEWGSGPVTTQIQPQSPTVGSESPEHGSTLQQEGEGSELELNSAYEIHGARR